MIHIWYVGFISFIHSSSLHKPSVLPLPPLSYNSLLCMWSFCLSSFPTDAIFFSLDLTADSCIPHHQPLFSSPSPGPSPPTLFPPSSSPSPSPLPFLCLISSPPLSFPSAPLPFLISYYLPSYFVFADSLIYM